MRSSYPSYWDYPIHPSPRNRTRSIIIEYYNSSAVIDRQTGATLDQLAGTNLIFIADHDLLLSRSGSSYLIQQSDGTFRTPENDVIAHIRALFYDERRKKMSR